MSGVLPTAILICEGALALPVAYLLLLTVTAVVYRALQSRSDLRPTLAGDPAPAIRFLILVPAHNEEVLLPATLQSLFQIDYPRSLYAVHVVADNCDDRTAELAREAGARVHERRDPELRGKGYALSWLLDRLWASGEPHDAIVMLDADSVVTLNFLSAMAARLGRGERVIQAYYAVRDPGRSWGAGLRYAALAAVHYLRPSARMALGASAGLKGNGMVFAADIPRRFRWSASLAEDVEYHMQLILAGERVTFAPEAVVYAEMPGTLKAAQTQNVRWERGRLEQVRRYVPELIRAGVARRSFLLLDAAAEQLIPPFAVLFGSSALLLLAAFLVGVPPAEMLGLATVAGAVIYTLSGLALARAPRDVYRALLYAPVFVAWKCWLYVRVLLGRDRGGWVRTARTPIPAGGWRYPIAANERTWDFPIEEKARRMLEIYTCESFRDPRQAYRVHLKVVTWAIRARLAGGAKRAFDLTLAALLLIVTAPLFLVTAVAVRLDSPGPILFRQVRVGRGGRLFGCYKFRSMYKDADRLVVQLAARNEADGPLFKMRRDPRVTRVGKVIRKLSVDELPQLINVLKGEMSLVGPRPALPREVERYDVEQLGRLDALPGITGLQQVSGRSNLTFQRWIELDLRYVNEQNLWEDVKILLRTIPAVIFSRGAY